MHRLLVAVIVLVTGTTARADMGLPFDRTIPVRITLTADPPPGVVLFIQDAGPIRRMPTTSPVVVESSQGRGWVEFSVYAVSESVVETWPAGTMPQSDWFRQPGNQDCKRVAGGYWKGRVDFTDSRSVIELGYRLVQIGDEMRLVQTSSNEPSIVYRGAATLTCCCAVPLGIAWLGLWVVRRMWRVVRPASRAA